MSDYSMMSHDQRKLAEAEERIQQLEQELAKMHQFKPDATHVNALPAPLKKYIHDIETICDEAGIIRENAALMDQRDALVVKTKELENERDAAVKSELEWRDANEKLAAFVSRHTDEMNRIKDAAVERIWQLEQEQDKLKSALTTPAVHLVQENMRLEKERDEAVERARDTDRLAMRCNTLEQQINQLRAAMVRTTNRR